MDGLKGLPEAVSAAFPKTLTQLCGGGRAEADLLIRDGKRSGV
jgi:hypothetical protein